MKAEISYIMVSVFELCEAKELEKLVSSKTWSHVLCERGLDV